MLKNLISNTKKHKTFLIILLCLSVGILMVFSDSKTTPKISESNTTDTEKYTTDLENRLEELINQISGVSSAKVLITLEQTNEYIYASDDSDTSQKHVIVNEALVYVTENLPKIKGVAIVCKGGNNDVTKRKITELTCSLLGIYSTSVYVTE